MRIDITRSRATFSTVKHNHLFFSFKTQHIVQRVSEITHHKVGDRSEYFVQSGKRNGPFV